MVHNLNDREMWSKQGEEYLRRGRSEPPVHPLISATRTAKGSENRKQSAKLAA
jgi:hypothetical protein